VARQLDLERQQEFEDYLKQWVTVIQRASERGGGIVAHEG
jgi:hypothetical protein